MNNSKPDASKVIGQYMGRPILASITHAGQSYDYDRIAVSDRDETFPLAQLESNELLVSPGLIYKR